MGIQNPPKISNPPKNENPNPPVKKPPIPNPPPKTNLTAKMVEGRRKSNRLMAMQFVQSPKKTLTQPVNHKSGSTSRRPSLLQNRPLIAFVPIDEEITDEMMELEEKLEAEHGHRRHSFEVDKRRESIRKSLMIDDSLIMPPGQHLLTNPLRKSHSILKNPSTYGWLPRPFTDHWADIEKRRARHIIDLMNSSKEDFEFAENDRRVKFCPNGILIFHVLELYNLAVTSTTFIATLPVSFYCVLSIGPVKRCSKIVHSSSARRIRVDYLANFSIEIPEWRESPLNRFNLELWSYQDPEVHYIVGSMEIHAYEFIRKQHAIEMSQLWSDGIKVGKIAFEYAFTYGTFGYGHSNHLKNPKNPIMETVCHSMYPRIRMDDNDLCDEVYKIRLPEQLKLFTYNSLILEMEDALDAENRKKKRKKSRPEDFESKTQVVQQVTFEEDKPSHCKLHMNIWQKEIQADFNDAYGEFVCFGTRKSRLDYLNNLIQGRMRDIRETEAGILFRPFKEREAEKVYKAEMPTGYLVYPPKIPCVFSWGTPKLNAEEEKFQSEFPTVRRETGYLNTLFGYQPKPDAVVYLNDMEAPLYKEAGKKKKRHLNLGCLRRFFIRIAAYFNLLYNFVFPEVTKRPQIPEVSLTTPTPEASTTNLFTYYVRDQKEVGMTKVEKLQAQTAALIEIAEKPLEVADDDSNLSSSSEDQEVDIFKKKKKRRTNTQTMTATAKYKTNKKSGFEGELNAPPKKNLKPMKTNFTGPGGHFKVGINQPLI